jgi:uncharacterized membrane-anchored protein
MLTLKLTQPLTKAESRHIKEILAREKFLEKLNDKVVFSADYESRDKTKDAFTLSLLTLLKQEVGPCLEPAHQLERSLGSSFMVHARSKSYKKVKFSLCMHQAPLAPKDDFVFLGVATTRLPTVFFYNCYLNQQLTKVSGIFTTALAFYNKPSLYKSISKVIKANEALLNSKLGKPLTEDISKLFSLRNPKQLEKAFSLKSIAKGEVSKTSVQLDKGENFKNFTLRYNFDKAYAEIGILSYLMPDNTLAIYTTLMNSNKTLEPISWTAEGIPAFMVTEKYQKFVLKWTKNCIANMAAMTFFGMELYKKFATKILITI